MNRLFSKFQILTAALFFMSAQWSYSQATGMTSGERSSIDLPEITLNTMEAATSGVKNPDALSLPFYEGFEASNEIPAGWTQEVVDGPLWTVGNGNSPYPSQAYSGNHNLVFRSYVPHASGLTTRLVMPALDLTGVNTSVLKFTYVNPYTFDFYGYQDVLTIKYKSALGDDWTTLQTFWSDVKEWTDVFITLPNPSASYYIAFEGKSNAGVGISIDEIAINEGVQITSENGESGAIYPLGEVLVPIGSSPRYKIRAYYHFHISSLLVDGQPIAEAVGQTDYYYTFPSVDTEHTIVANFMWSESYTVSAEAVPSEAGTVHIEGDLFYNQTIRLWAYLSTDRYYFSHWTSNGDSISAANPLSIVLKSDTSFRAHYKLVDQALTLPVYEGFEANSTLPEGWTQELINGPHWKIGQGNSPYPLTAYAGNNNLIFRSDIPDASGLFTRLVTPQLDMTGSNSPILKFYYVNAENTNTGVHQDWLTVKYKAAYYDSWTTLSTLNTDVKEWTEVSIVLPNPSGTYFIAFEGKSNAGYGISIDEVTINEEQMDGFFITATAGANGSIQPSGQVFVPSGETQQFSMEADYGHHISSLLVDDEAIAEAGGESQFTFTFESVHAPHSILAYFLPNTQNVSVDAVPMEAGSVSIQGELYYGNTITLWPMSTGDEYVFTHWTSNGVTISTENPLIFVLQSDTSIQAIFGRATGIGSNLNERMQIYPNPAHDYLVVNLPAKAFVQVFDLQGRLQFEANLQNGNRKLNLSDFEHGMYIIKVKFEDRLITRRILHF